MDYVKTHHIVPALLLALAALSFADTYTVTNTKDKGAGSLRQAMLDAEAHSGEDIVEFNIPATDAGYNATTKTWKIITEGYLPELVNGRTKIKGFTQKTNRPKDAKTYGPVIELSGEKQIGTNFCIIISSAENLLEGLIINLYTMAVTIQNKGSRFNRISGNYIGTNHSGTAALPNGVALWIRNGASKNTIGSADSAFRNLISGNSGGGVAIDMTGTDSNRVIGNYIGTDVTGEKALGNKYGGIIITNGRANFIGGYLSGEGNVISGTTTATSANNGAGIYLDRAGKTQIIGNLIGTNKTGKTAIPNASFGITMIKSDSNLIGDQAYHGNTVSGNIGFGILVMDPESHHNSFIGNIIGASTDQLHQLPNGMGGIHITSGANNNIIGKFNCIAYNKGAGVMVVSNTSTGNRITQNNIFANTGQGIDLQSGANNNIAAPVILEATITGIKGKAKSGQLIEIFSDANDEGGYFEGETTTDNSGNFSWSGKTHGKNVTAVAIDDQGNTSEFSKAVASGVASKSTLAPDQFVLRPGYPNPFNAGTTLEYNIPVAGRVQIRLFDVSGQEKSQLMDEVQNAGHHRFILDGQALASGLYFVQVRYKEWSATQKITLVR